MTRSSARSRPTTSALSTATPGGWRDEQAEWAARFGQERVLELPTNSVQRMPPAVDRFRTALAEGRISHSGDLDLRRHLLNARLRKVGRDESGLGRFTLERAGPGRLIDCAIAAVLAAYEVPAQVEAVAVRDGLVVDDRAA